MNANVDLSVVSYGKISHSLDELPRQTLAAFVRKGMGHYYGNEISAKLTQARAKRADSELGPMNDAELATLEEDLLQAAYQAALAGEVGLPRQRGPRVDPVEAEFKRLCELKARAILKAAGFTMPSGDKTITFASGEVLGRADLIHRASVRYGETLRREAEALVAKREREAQGATHPGAKSLEDLGL